MESLRYKAISYASSILRTNEAKLFLLTLLVYSLSLSLHFQYSKWLGWFHIYYGWDGNTYFALTRSIIFDGDLILDNECNACFLSKGVGNHYYSGHFPGLSFFAIPFFLIGGKYGIAFVNIIVSSFLIVTIYKLCSFYVRATLSFWISILMAFCTMIWIYSNTFFTEPLAGFLLTLGILLTKRSIENKNEKESIFAGLATGYAVFVRPLSLLPALFLIFYFIGKKMNRLSVLYTLAFAISLIPLGIYDLICFGSPFRTGYHSIIYPTGPESYNEVTGRWNAPLYYPGIIGIFFDPVHGLFLGAPIFILSILGFYYLYKEEKLDTLLFVILFLSTTLIYAHWWMWYGGYCFSSRNCYTVIPILSVPLASLINKWWHKNWLYKILFIFLAIVSFLFTAAGLNYYYWVANPVLQILKIKFGINI